MQFTPQEIELLKMCITKMLEVNNLQYGEMCCNILLGTTDRSEELQKLLTKISTENELEIL
jgi:hypothetical protein